MVFGRQMRDEVDLDPEMLASDAEAQQQLAAHNGDVFDFEAAGDGGAVNCGSSGSGSDMT